MAEQTELEQALDRIKTAIKNYSTNPVTEITIGTRTLRRPTIAELVTAMKQLETEVAREGRIAEGTGRKPIRFRFQQPS